jgi:hypothetical protein
MNTQDSIAKSLMGLANAIAQLTDNRALDWRSVLSAQIAELAKLVERPTATNPIDTADLEAATKILASRGWYIDGELPSNIAKPIIESVTHNAESSIDSYFVNHFSQQIDKIQENLCSNFPSRAKALNEAFAAHRAAQYFLSIPVFLAQADGICAEKLGGKLFYKQDDVAKYLKGLHLDAWLDVYLSVLQVP